MAEGQIPIRAIAWETQRLEMDPLEAEAFEYVIRAVDVSYMKRQAAKQRKAQNRAN